MYVDIQYVVNAPIHNIYKLITPHFISSQAVTAHLFISSK